MPAVLNISNREALGNVKLIGDALGRAALRGGLRWMREDVLGKIQGSETYGFTNRSGDLRGSLRVVTVTPQARDAGGRFVSEGFAELRSNIIYAARIEYDYGSKYSYTRRAISEQGSKLDVKVAEEVAEMTARLER